MSHKAAESTLNISNTFGPGTANKRSVQWWFEKFCKGDLKMKIIVDSYQKLTVTNRAVIEPDPLNSYMRSCQRTVLIILWSFGVWSKLERWRKLVSGSLMSWPKPKKIIVLKCDLLFYIMTTNHSLIIYNTYVHIPRSHVTKIGLYMTTGSNQFSGWTDKKLQRTSKAKLAPKNGHGLSFVVCCQFDALQLSASQWNHCIWEVCSANQCLQLTLVNRKGPVLLHNNASKLEQNWAVKFCLIFIHS